MVLEIMEQVEKGYKPQIEAADRRYTMAELKELTEVVLKNTPANTNADAVPMHGPLHSNPNFGGIFSRVGSRAEVFSAYQRPRSIVPILGVDRSIFQNNDIDIMTGVTAGSGTNAANFCGDPPEPGVPKRCTQRLTFGDWYEKTGLADVISAGQRVNPADLDRRIMNFATAPNQFFPTELLAQANLNDRGQTLLASAILALVTDWERNFERIIFRGTRGVDDETFLGWFTQFAGIENQVITGRRDLDTDTLCPAADSEVITFSADIGGTQADGRDIVTTVTDLYEGLQQRAEDVGMSGTTMAFAGTWRLFHSLVNQWACNYATSFCTGTAGNPNGTDAAALKQFRDQLLNDRFLLISGVPVPFMVTDGPTEVNVDGANVFNSDLFLLPIDGPMGRFLTLEYKPQDTPEQTEWVRFLGTNSSGPAPIGGGRFMHGIEQTAFCVEHHFATKIRLILDAPFLAGRIDDISYSFLAPLRAADPADTFAHVDGGVHYTQSNLVS